MRFPFFAKLMNSSFDGYVILFSDKNNNQNLENLENTEKSFSKKDILKEHELKQIKGGTGEDDDIIQDWE